MNLLKLSIISAFTVMSLGLASPSLAEGDGGCVKDCDPPPEDPKDPPPQERVKGNNGLGNGDQPAPGNSLTRNRAENQVGNPGHPSGKAQNSN
jgi:hypothetical protein